MNQPIPTMLTGYPVFESILNGATGATPCRLVNPGGFTFP